LSGRLWRARAWDAQEIQALQRGFGLSEIAARILAGRGVKALEAAGFLNPTLREFFPDPSCFIDMDQAVEVVEEAIQSKRKCAVFADYDVDGGTSAALLVRYFRARGRDLHVYVPDRSKEGYGPSAAAFAQLQAQGVELVITVDCGAAAHAPLEAAAAMGLDVVVFDHHLMSGPAPPARAVVNPNRPDCPSGQGALTAAGVVFVALAGLNRHARRKGLPGSNHLPDPMAWLDLAALGTVCDVAPLTGFNRAIVAQGLKVLGRGANIGLAALARVAGREGSAKVYDLGFVLGPRLNAGGRIGDSSLATRLLASEEPAEVEELALRLDQLNAERRSIEQNILAEAIAQADGHEGKRNAVVVAAPHWHPGVIGVVAGRLKERLLKPVIVIGGGCGEEPAKGSGRSVAGVNLGRAVAAAARDGLLLAGGGHAMAAGLSLDWANLDRFRDYLADATAQECAASVHEARSLWIDAVASIRALDFSLLAAIEAMGPYGAGHSEPILALTDVRVTFAQRMKGEHVRATLQDVGGHKIRAIAFRCADGPIGQALLARAGSFSALVRISRNSYRGLDEVQAEIIDLA
jgi:single-stranded-DNA-specific exonuclease